MEENLKGEQNAGSRISREFTCMGSFKHYIRRVFSGFVLQISTPGEFLKRAAMQKGVHVFETPLPFFDARIAYGS